MHPFSASLSSPGASTSAHRTRRGDEEDGSEPESLSFPYSYDISELEVVRSSSPKLTSRSSSGPAKLSKRPLPSSSSDRLSPMVKLQKARGASSSKLRPSSSQPPRSMFKSHADHLNTEEILHMIDPQFYSSLTPSTSSTPPSTSRLGDDKHDPYGTHSRYHTSSSHALDLSRPYTDAEGRLHDPAFRTFDVEIAPHAQRARASRSSSGTPAGVVSRGISPGREREHTPTRSQTRMVPSDSGKQTRVWNHTTDAGVPASLDPLLSPTAPSPASWDNADVGYGSPEYDSEPGMDPHDGVIVTTREASRNGMGFAGTNSSNSPLAHHNMGHNAEDGKIASNPVAEEESDISKGPSEMRSVHPPRRQFVDDRTPYSSRRTPSSLLAPPDHTASSRQTPLAATPDSGSGARTPHRPVIVRELSRSTLYPRPLADNPFPSQMTMARAASQGPPRFIAPPLSPPASVSSQSDDEYTARRRSRRKGRGSPIMGMPEGYLDDEDSPFKPVVVQPVEPEKPVPKGVVPALFASYHGSRPASPAPGGKKRSAKSPNDPVAAAAHRKGKRERLEKEPWHSHESDHNRQRKSAAKKAGLRGKLSSRDGESESEKFPADRRSLGSRSNGAHYSYALQLEPHSFGEDVNGFLRTEKPRIGAPPSSIGTAERDTSFEARSPIRNQYVPSHHGKSISIRPGVDVIQDDYT